VAWLLEEDALLKEKLQGIIVRDARADPTAGRPVKVWFRFPEPEIREVEYPFVTIDLINISEALDRAHRGAHAPPVTQYVPPDELPEPVTGKVLVTEYPIAMNIDYQVTTWARNIHHDRQMTQQLWVMFPGRYGSIGGNADPYVRPRSCQLIGFAIGDRLDEFQKRLFRKMYTVRVFSELWASQIKQITQVTTISIDMPSLFGDEPWITVLDCHE
jgi:hypothetical protein